MHLIPIKTPLIKPGDSVQDIVRDLVHKNVQENAPNMVQNKDILVISSKIIAVAENRIIDLSTMETSEEAEEISKISELSPKFSELVIQEADEVLGAVPGAILTITDGIMIANAGVDQSNVPDGKAVLWPKNSEKSAKNLRDFLMKEFKLTDVGIIISDSHCLPLRNGTSAFALCAVGFEAVKDERGRPDLYGKEMHVTQRNIGDMIASGAGVLMGDTDERIPIVIARDINARFTDDFDSRILKMEREKCMFRELF